MFSVGCRGSLLVAAVFHDACSKSDASAPSCFGQQGQLLRHSRPSKGPFSRATGLRVAANFGVAVRAPARQPTAPATGSLQRPVRPPALNCDRLSATPSFEMAAAADADASTVSVRFVSRLPEPVDIPESAFAVPEGLTRKGLAEVINGLLQLDPPQPFDFLINEEFLRCSLATFLKNRHVRRAFTRSPSSAHTPPAWLGMFHQ